MPNERKDIGALWEKETKNGQLFLAGQINGQDVVIFKNGYKEKDKQPDWKVYPAQKKQETRANDDDFLPLN